MLFARFNLILVQYHMSFDQENFLFGGFFQLPETENVVRASEYLILCRLPTVLPVSHSRDLPYDLTPRESPIFQQQFVPGRLSQQRKQYGIPKINAIPLRSGRRACPRSVDFATTVRGGKPAFPTVSGYLAT
jgi:hypothetical protein